jgi:hypothetical protein
MFSNQLHLISPTQSIEISGYNTAFCCCNVAAAKPHQTIERDCVENGALTCDVEAKVGDGNRHRILHDRLDRWLWQKIKTKNVDVNVVVSAL